MKIDGACHCGHIRYEAEVDPKDVGICHCTDCQTLSGSAFRTFAFTREGSFKLLAGQLKIYVKTGDSGAERPQSFCPNCGTPIYSTTAGEGPKVHSLRAGTIRQRNELPPRFQIWARSEQDWICNLHSIPKVPKQEAVPFGPRQFDSP
jgi:hypothetical protein